MEFPLMKQRYNPDNEHFSTVYSVNLTNHARCVACNPKYPDHFVIGEAGGRLSVHSISRQELIHSFTIAQPRSRNIVTACAYSYDGRRIIYTLKSEKLCVLDVETEKIVRIFSNCACKSDLKCGLALHSSSDSFIASTNAEGNGVTFYDCRQAKTPRNLQKLHLTWVPDIQFVPQGWPWSRRVACLATVCTDGQLKIVGEDGTILDVVDVGHVAHCCALTPETYTDPKRDFSSYAVVGGECISTILPGLGLQRKLAFPKLAACLGIKFTSSGSRAFIACEDGSVQILQRSPQKLRIQDSLMIHRKAISDISITATDEYVVTTSEDGHVKVTKIGLKNHGASGWFEIR